MTDALLIGLSGLSAQQRAMEVTSHNIANATTPGYSRQRIEMLANIPENLRPGQVGTGVRVDAIRRAVDDLLGDRLRAALGEFGRLDSLSGNLKNLESSFNEPGDAGLSKLTNDVFAAFEDLSNNPESSALRSTAVQSVTAWTQNLNALADRLDRLSDDLRSGLEGEIRDINGMTSEIATLNQNIRTQSNLGNNPNDLMDRRDLLLEQLSERMAITVRRQPDGSALADVAGTSIVGSDDAIPLTADVDANNKLVVRLPNGTALRPSGGRVAAIIDVQRSVLSAVTSDIDTIAATVMQEMNGLYATATSHAMDAQNHLGSMAIPFTLGGTDLDDASLEPAQAGADGIPELFRPNFTDPSGTLVARNLTINVLDTVTDVARKYTVRWDPTVGSGGRSLSDLVSAINTGRGGGFSTFPPTAGIGNVTAQAVAVNGAFRLSLTATAGSSIDFSPALDLKPSSEGWTGPNLTITAAGSDAAYADQRIGVRASTTGQLQVFTRNVLTGAAIIHGTVNLAAGGAVAVGGITVTIPATAGTMRIGDQTALDVSSAGAPSAATVLTGTWTASDAAVNISGRYSGQLTYDASKPWSMKVLTTGVIGAKTGTAIPNNPPLVEFTYWTGVSGSEIQKKIQYTLDSSKPAGTPLPLGDGVYATVSTGSLTTVGNSVSFNPDSQPDQAGLLPALGINGLFQGTRALDAHVADAVLANPDRLSVGTTRAEGDNSRVLDLLQLRSAKMFGGGAFTIEDFYQGVITGVGTRVQQAVRGVESQTVLRESLNGRKASISGVNIDEEVGNLILQQQAYAAAARLISTSRENIQTLLQILG